MKTVDGQTHAYHLVPCEVSKAAAVAAHARARGYAPEDCIAVGDSVEDLEVSASVGRFFVVANGPRRTRPARLPAPVRQRHRHRGHQRRRLLRGGRRVLDGPLSAVRDRGAAEFSIGP